MSRMMTMKKRMMAMRKMRMMTMKKMMMLRYYILLEHKYLRHIHY
jgi:hypothetical protein